MVPGYRRPISLPLAAHSQRKTGGLGFITLAYVASRTAPFNGLAASIGSCFTGLVHKLVVAGAPIVSVVFTV
jgi:hypothetical protein